MALPPKWVSSYSTMHRHDLFLHSDHKIAQDVLFMLCAYNYITHSLIAVNWMSILDCTIRYSKCPKLHDEFTIKNYAFFNSSLC